MSVRNCTCPNCVRGALALELRDRTWPLVVRLVTLPWDAAWARVAPLVTRWGSA